MKVIVFLSIAWIHLNVCRYYLIVCKTLKNVKEIYEMQENTQSSQIKGEFQLNELNEAVEFITKNLASMKQKGRRKKKL